MAKPTRVDEIGPGTPLGDAARRLVGARLADVRQYEAPLRAGAEGDVVHDMRVAARRLRAALRLFARRELAAEAAATKRLQDALGAVRDLHVQAAWLEARRREADHGGQGDGAADVAAVLDVLVGEARARLPDLVGDLARAAEQWSAEAGAVLVERLDQIDFDEGGGGVFGGAALFARLRKLLGRVRDGTAATLASPDASTAHALRIAVKKLRYAAELLDAAAPRTLAALLATLVPLQERLGDLHDADVRLALLEDHARRAAPALRRAALDLVRAVEAERAAMATSLGVELQGIEAEHLVRRLGRLVG